MAQVFSDNVRNTFMGLRKTSLAALGIAISIRSYGAINCPADSSNRYDSIVKIIRTEPNDKFHCTGTIVERCFVLTAAHCVYKGRDKTELALPAEFTIKGGTSSQENLGRVAEVIPHPDYRSGGKPDVAIIRLARCTERGMTIDYSPFTSARDVIVGGYGVRQLNSFTSQPIRHMGPSKIAHFDEDQICLESQTIEADGIRVRDSTNCLPTGQDSDSPMIQNNKIRGVYVKGIQQWHSDGTTTESNCYANVRSPRVRSFIEEALSKVSNVTPAHSPTPAGSVR